MPQPKTNLDVWRGTIEQRIAEGQTQDEILTWLQGEGVRVTLRTFQRILQAWGTLSNRTRLRNSLQDPSLPTAVYDLWPQHQLDDT
jgi:hypothetical protein